MSENISMVRLLKFKVKKEEKSYYNFKLVLPNGDTVLIKPVFAVTKDGTRASTDFIKLLTIAEEESLF